MTQMEFMLHARAKVTLFNAVSVAYIFTVILSGTILALKKTGYLSIKTKIASEYSQRVFTSQPIRTRAPKLFYIKAACLSYGEYTFYLN